jgi:glycosyltransferase involved in cell wall biosynthesis
MRIGGAGILPKGAQFECLKLLAYYEGKVSEALSTKLEPDPGPGWLKNVDAVLRSTPKLPELFAVTRAVQRLRKSELWEDFVAAAAADASELTRLRREAQCLRSLWGVTPLISLKQTVAADKSIGVNAESLVFSTYYVTQSFDINLSHHVKVLQKSDPSTLDAFYWLVLLWAIFSYDIFFFFNDRGILPPREFTGRFHMGINHEELALLRRAGKYLYTLPYGADYRTRERATTGKKFNFCMECPSVGEYCFCNDEAWGRVFHTTAAYATAILGTGLSLRELPGARRLDYVVLDTDRIKPTFSRIEPGRKIRVLHVPNHAFFKGTRYLEAAIKQLEGEGASIELKLVSGVSNDEVLRLMQWADLIVDQLIGGYFGQTALEGMAVGKPVIVYLSDPELVVASQECPLINANPDTIYDVLKGIVEAPSQLEEIGRRSRRYVEDHYSLPALACRLRELYHQTAGITLQALPDDLEVPRV